MTDLNSRQRLWVMATAIACVPALVFVWSLKGDGVTGESCRVEAKLSLPAKQVAAFGDSLPDPAGSLDRYSVLTNPQSPDYRLGINKANESVVYLFLATCEESKKSIATFRSAYDGRVEPPFLKIISIRRPRPNDYRRAPMIMARPKFWSRECVVEVEIVRQPEKKRPQYPNIMDFLGRQVMELFSGMPIATGSRSPGNSRFYINFWNSCDRRFEMTKSFLARYERMSYDGGEYRVIERDFDPKSRNSRTTGPMYLDHYYPKGPPVKWKSLGKIPAPPHYGRYPGGINRPASR